MEDNKKNYCPRASNECKIVYTGFHINQYWVCRTCKTEVSERLAKQKLDGHDLETYGQMNLWATGDDI